MYTCDQALCYFVHAESIGHTTTIINKRMKEHTSIKKHHMETHRLNITGSQMSPNVAVFTKMSVKMDLAIMEAILIKEHKPVINVKNK